MAKIKVPHDHVLMRHADPSASCTIEGVTYACEHGRVVVPTSAAGHLVAHGFVADGTDADQEAPPVVEKTAEEAMVDAEVERVAEEVAEAVAEVESEPAAPKPKVAPKPRKPKS